MKLKQTVTLFAPFIIISIIAGCAFANNTIEAVPANPTPESPPSPSQQITGNPPFPRLGMWWPEPYEQDHHAIARYDWVSFFPYQEEHVASIKAINPDIILLNSTNACELGYNPDPDADPGDNAEVLAIPPEWFLTQVGTTLTQDVDASTTTFHIAAASVTDGEESFDLFVVGDAVLIEGETVLVKAVDTNSKSLTVKRGYVRPAAAHNSGTRIAAHISFWPGTWLLNLSTLSPTAVVNPTIGAEQWASYNARVGAALLANDGWDGLLLDRSDPNESWLVGGSTARTIDPDQSNHLLTDYTTFDDAWNAGVRQYEQELRRLIGEEKILFPNWGMNNYDLLNGNNYEGFPLDNGDSYKGSWRQTVFGTLTDVGNYTQWMAQGKSPNLTMIETYEDDGGPSATGDGSYHNPCGDDNFVPNYQKMRFGLTTALLNDGYFGYEINTNGHGSLCLLWFDEYDNAGAGRGYLGQPVGAAYRTSNVMLGDNALNGGSFETESDLDLWDLWADDGNEATMELDESTASVGNASTHIHINQTTGTDWKISLSLAPVAVISGTEYTLSFWAKADRPRELSSWIQKNGSPWDGYLDFSPVQLTTAWQQYEVVATASDSDVHAIFEFGLGQATGEVWLDDVRLQTGNLDLWRRDYEHGIILVNATQTAQTVDLNGTFHKINGSQVPSINDGSEVSQVTIPALDGLILLGETAVSSQLSFLPTVMSD